MLIEIQQRYDASNNGAVLISSRAAAEPSALGIIGKDHLLARFATIDGFEPASFQDKKVTETTDGVPFVIETAFGWIGCDDMSRQLVTDVNWSPGISA